MARLKECGKNTSKSWFYESWKHGCSPRETLTFLTWRPRFPTTFTPYLTSEPSPASSGAPFSHPTPYPLLPITLSFSLSAWGIHRGTKQKNTLRFTHAAYPPHWCPQNQFTRSLIKMRKQSPQLLSCFSGTWRQKSQIQIQPKKLSFRASRCPFEKILNLQIWNPNYITVSSISETKRQPILGTMWVSSQPLQWYQKNFSNSPVN